MSNTLPWRTLATPPTPSDLSAPSIALPCGSRMPVLRVTVTRAFMDVSQAPYLVIRARFREQSPATRHLSALAGEPHGRPQRGRHAGDDRDAVALLEGPGDTQRPQPAAGDQQPFGIKGFLAYLRAEVENIGLAHPARSTEIGDAGTIDGPHLETLMGQEIFQTPVDLAIIGRCHRELFGFDCAQSVDHRRA